MEWSSDGYVLAVGWQRGWAIFSVGGRCLAWGFGIEDPIDEKYATNSRNMACTDRECRLRFQDFFMHGILDLVSGL